jgi:hypothetical protein
MWHRLVTSQIAICFSRASTYAWQWNPILLDIEGQVPEHQQGKATTQYFKYVLLRWFGFVLNIKATISYLAHINAVYSYQHALFTYSQLVHRSGVAFTQVLRGMQGFLFLINCLMSSGCVGRASPVGFGEAQCLAVDAEQLRVKLHAFCAD